MARRRKEPKVRMVCEDCGSTDVMRDAWAHWDVESQDWVLGAVFDYAHCDACGGETNIEERPPGRRRKTAGGAPPAGG
jgi:hypothetical protein